MKLRRLMWALAASSLCLLVGCMTTEEAANLNSQMENLSQRVANIERRLASEQPTEPLSERKADLETTMEDLRREIQILRANIEEDRDLIRRLNDQLQTLKLEHETKVGALPRPEQEKTVKAPSAGEPTGPVAPVAVKEEDAEGSYQQAYNTFKQGDYANALTLFGKFLAKYSETEYADNAQYWVGECYYRQEDYERAILEYEKLLKRYPKGDKVPSALLKQGFAFLNLGDKVDAKLLFKKVIKEYPHSPQAQIARRKLETLQ